MSKSQGGFAESSMAEVTLRSVYDSAPIAIVSVDSAGKVMDSNSAFQKSLGYSSAELAGMHILEFSHESDRKHVAEIFASLVEGKEDLVSFEKRCLRKDLSLVWGRLNVAAVRDSRGRFSRAIVMIIDISPEKTAIEDQASALSLLEATIDATDEGLLVVDVAGKILKSNRRFAELWQMPAELLSLNDDEALLNYAQNQLLHPEHFIPKVHEVYANRDIAISDILEFRDGRVVARSSRPYRLRDQTAGIVWSFRDITAQSRAEVARNEAFLQEIRARNEAETERRRAERISEASRLLAESLDLETTIRTIQEIVVPRIGDWSAIGVREGETGMRLLGFRVEPPMAEIADRIQNLTILDPNAPEGIPRVIRTGKAVLYPTVTEDDLKSENGSWPIIGTRDPETLAAVRKTGLCSFMIVPLLVRGKVIGAMSIGSTQAARKYGPAELLLAEEIGRRSAIAIDNAVLYRDALRTIQVREDFLSVASHELRTPLSPLRMQFEMAHLFVKDLPLTIAKRADLLALMEGASLQMDRLLTLVDNLLDVSRITAGRLKLRLEPFDLAALVAEVVRRFEPMFRKAECTLEMNLPAQVDGYWDRSRIDQVVSNLLSNAMKFGAGTKIGIELFERDGEAHLRVSDGGNGIAPEDIGRVFERFERGASAAGTHGFGLGLYISREIVSAHSGKISVESEPDRGARFTVRLPLQHRP